MDPVSAVASLVAIYQLASAVSSLCFRYGQGVKGADRDADLVITEIDIFQRYLRNVKEALVDEDISSDGALRRLRKLNEIIHGESAALKICERRLEDMKSKLIRIESEGRLREIMHRLSWPFKQEEVRRTVDLLKRFTEAVDRALNVDNNEAIRGIDRTTKRIEISMERAESQDEKGKVLDWLSHPDPSHIHEIRRCDRNDRAKTGKWFLGGSIFQTFKATPQSVLWLHGDSGCGKSVLCSGVIDEICALREKDPRIELAYWYFSVTDKTRTTVDTFLRALIAQLVLECPMPLFLLEAWRARKMGREPPRVAELMEIVQKILVGKPPHRFFIIVDAVDESEENERAELMQFLRSLALFEADIHILMTSRTNTAGVEKVVKDLANFYNVAMEGQDSDHDIVAHVSERLENDAALAKWSPELRKSIKEALVKDAGGMFRWVECQLQAIRKCKRPAEVKKALKTLPKNLHEVYARELAKVDESAMQDVLRLLEWLAFPLRKCISQLRPMS